jgi:hypothetical protein
MAAISLDALNSRRRHPSAGEKRPSLYIQTPPAPEETWGPPNSCLRMRAQRPNTSTHSADLPHHDKMTNRQHFWLEPMTLETKLRRMANCTMSRFENIDTEYRRTLWSPAKQSYEFWHGSLELK